MAYLHARLKGPGRHGNSCLMLSLATLQVKVLNLTNDVLSAAIDAAVKAGGNKLQVDSIQVPRRCFATSCLAGPCAFYFTPFLAACRACRSWRSFSPLARPTSSCALGGQARIAAECWAAAAPSFGPTFAHSQLPPQTASFLPLVTAVDAAEPRVEAGGHQCCPGGGCGRCPCGSPSAGQGTAGIQL
jgi:hypothetical protein